MDQPDLMVTVPGMGQVLVLGKERVEELVVLEGLGVLARLVGLDLSQIVPGMDLEDAKGRKIKIKGKIKI